MAEFHSDFDVATQAQPVKKGLVSEAKPVVSAWVVLLTLLGLTLRHFSDGDYTFVVTAGAGVQCLGFWLLLQKVNSARSAAGVSSKMLEMYLIQLIFRLSSTLIKEGYLPIDRSGDHIYQAFDIGSLCLVFQLLWCVNKKYKTTYESEFDTMPVWNAVPGLLVLAMCVHGHMNKSFFYDTVWTFSMHLDTIAMLPQFWLFVKKGGAVEAALGHFVACIVASRALSFAFWFYGYQALKPRKRDGGGPNIAGYLVFASHAMQLLLSADFMYHYVSSAMGKVKMILPAGQTCDV
jgi:hypothetical protein